MKWGYTIMKPEILIEINYYAHRILHEPHYIHATSLTQKERNE